MGLWQISKFDKITQKCAKHRVLQKALNGARLLYRESINDLAVYHAHQCAEKALKGFLAFKLCSIQKSHDLVVLAEQCCRYDPSFEKIRPFVEALNPFGTLTRYPSNRPDPDPEITLDSISKAESVFLFIQTKIFEAKNS